MRKKLARALAALILIPAIHAAGADPPHTAATSAPAPNWDPAAAARYLDARESWWQNWDHDRRDHDTRCVSCHTQATYAFARPALRTRSGEANLTPQETVMLADVRKRVQSWKDMLPFYSDAVYGQGKEIESRNAESILNAIILSSYDVAAGRQDPITQQAFRNAWDFQSLAGPNAGAWVWQDFNYAPWESKESQYHWAALMAIQVAREPGSYAAQQDVRPHLLALAAYLKSHYDSQPLLNKIVALWADSSCPGILTRSQRASLLAQLFALQKLDGGWTTTALGTWHRRDNTPLETRSDGYATGLIALVLQQAIAGAPHAPPSTPQHIQRALQWLRANQNLQTGAWPAWSLNKNRDPDSGPGKFMSDAATAYASLALLEK